MVPPCDPPAGEHRWVRVATSNAPGDLLRVALAVSLRPLCAAHHRPRTRMTERSRSLGQLLGFADDARVLIVNADDFGMCHAENVATMDGLDQGAFDCATIMVPCPWFEEVVAFARRTAGADLGVHITHTSEWGAYKWGPVLGSAAVPSLVDERGHLHPDVPSLYAHARLDEVERETRAQIDRALAAGIDVTH